MSKPIDALLRAHARRRSFKRGAVVVADGEPAGGLWCVESGAIAVSGQSTGQRDFIFRFRQPGEWFGETALLDGLPWTYDHIASGKTVALHVPHREAQRLIAAHPELKAELVRVTCARLRLTAEYVEEIIVPDLPARIAYHLLVIGRESAQGLVPGKQLEVHLTQSVLASLLGATREAVGRHLVRWRDAGWIALRYGRVTLLDPQILEQIANGERRESELAAAPSEKRALVKAS
jgi:CRP-like cAMP-binding protein